MSFLVNLAKRKKSPEQLVKLTIGLLHELPPHEELDGSSGGASGGHGQEAEGHGEDELVSSCSGSLASASEFHRAGSTGSDAAAEGGNKGTEGARRAEGYHQQKSKGDGDGHAAHAEGEGRRSGMLGGKHSLSVQSIFFSDPGKRSTSSVGSPALHHAHSLTDKEETTVMGRLTKRLGQMKHILYGEAGDKDVDQHKCEELGEHVVKENLAPLLLEHLSALPFEARKDAASIFTSLCRHNHGGFADPYLARTHFELVERLITGYHNMEIALICGTMLRECLKHEKIARRILFSPEGRVWLFFDEYVHLPNFDVASDAFTTLKDLLTRHKALAAQFLDKEYDQVSEKYKSLLKSENYVTRRMSLKMLGELLVERANFAIMMRYISSKDNLKAIMMLLRDKSGQIQFEAFQIFKVFVANPKKPPEIIKILVANREKLVAYLEHFHNEKSDEQFREEKALLIATLDRLEYHEPEAAAAGTQGEGGAAEPQETEQNP